MSDIEFADGFYANEPHPNAPDFVKAKVSVNCKEFIKWLEKQDDEFINLDILEAKSTGNWYVKVDRWKPDPSKQRSQPSRGLGKGDRMLREGRDIDDDIPF